MLYHIKQHTKKGDAGTTAGMTSKKKDVPSNCHPALQPLPVTPASVPGPPYMPPNCHPALVAGSPYALPPHCHPALVAGSPYTAQR